MTTPDPPLAVPLLVHPVTAPFDVRIEEASSASNHIHGAIFAFGRIFDGTVNGTAIDDASKLLPTALTAYTLILCGHIYQKTLVGVTLVRVLMNQQQTLDQIM